MPICMSKVLHWLINFVAILKRHKLIHTYVLYVNTYQVVSQVKVVDVEQICPP